MPELREVFEMTTNQMEPDTEAWRKQEKRQRRSTKNKKLGAFAVAAAIALVAVVAVVRSTPGDGSPAAGTDASPSAATTPVEAPVPAGTLTFDGSACSWEFAGGPIEPGVVVFDAVNTSEQRVMFDTYELVNGYTFERFERRIERMARLQERGQEADFPRSEPTEDQQVRYLGSEVVPANGSGTVAVATTTGSGYAFVCLRPYEGLGLRPAALAGEFFLGGPG